MNQGALLMLQRALGSLSKNFQITPVCCIIEETGVFLWNNGEKMREKNQSSSISIRWFPLTIFFGRLKK